MEFWKSPYRAISTTFNSPVYELTNFCIHRGCSSCLRDLIEHLTPCTLSPTDLIVRRYPWECRATRPSRTHSAYALGVWIPFAKPKNRPTVGRFFGFAKVIQTPSSCDVRVLLGLVALPFQVDCLAIRSVGDRVYGARCLPLLFQGDSIRQLSDSTARLAILRKVLKRLRITLRCTTAHPRRSPSRYGGRWWSWGTTASPKSRSRW